MSDYYTGLKGTETGFGSFRRSHVLYWVCGSGTTRIQGSPRENLPGSLPRQDKETSCGQARRAWSGDQVLPVGRARLWGICFLCPLAGGLFETVQQVRAVRVRVLRTGKPKYGRYGARAADLARMLWNCHTPAPPSPTLQEGTLILYKRRAGVIFKHLHVNIHHIHLHVRTCAHAHTDRLYVRELKILLYEHCMGAESTSGKAPEGRSLAPGTRTQTTKAEDVPTCVPSAVGSSGSVQDDLVTYLNQRAQRQRI